MSRFWFIIFSQRIINEWNLDNNVLNCSSVFNCNGKSDKQVFAAWYVGDLSHVGSWVPADRSSPVDSLEHHCHQLQSDPLWEANPMQLA